MDSSRNPSRVFTLTTIVVAIGALLCWAPPAYAAVSHVLSTTYGAASSTPADPYPLSEPSDIEVDQASHDIYVTDPGNHRIEKFNSSGEFLLMFGKEVDRTRVEAGGATEAEKNVCPSTPGDTCQTGTPGSGSGDFEDPTYLAVDNSEGPSKGDVYVADPGDGLVQKFDANGNIILTWGNAGQKDGSDTDLSSFTLSGQTIFGIAVGSDGTLYVGGSCCDNVFAYTPSGTYIPPYRNISGLPFLKADPAGNLYTSNAAAGNGEATVWEAALQPGTGPAQYVGYQMGTATPLTGFDFDPSTRELYQDTGSAVAHYSGDCNPLVGPCNPLDDFGSGDLSNGKGVAVDGESHTVYVANSGDGDVAVFGDVRPIVTTTPAINPTESGTTLTGHIDPAGRGPIVACHFEYGFDETYGSSIPCTPNPASGNFTEPTNVTAIVTGLSPGTRDHYRLVATNAAGGTANGQDRVFATTQSPTVDGLASANLTARSASLEAEINPNGLNTTYQFEYGPTISYGESAPVTAGELSASEADQSVVVDLTNLTPHVVYHYRLVATNADGTTTTGDQTFNFYPPSCPNENVRQQTQTNYLPDCRAYELVSPGNAGGTQLYPGGPNTGYATTPPRFAFTGLWSTIPEAGGMPIDGVGDLYVATRTDTGWQTKYVGPPSNQIAIAGGPPQGLPDTGGSKFFERTTESNGGANPDIIQNNVLTDPGMDTFLDWNDGNQATGNNFQADLTNTTPMASNAPYVWNANGQYLDRWPTNLASVPNGQYPPGWKFYTRAVYVEPGDEPLAFAPGGEGALDCPGVSTDDHTTSGNYCPGDVTASSDLSHFAFATEWNVFAPGGQLRAPGSVYDNDTRTDSIAIASKAPAGNDIPSEPGDAFGDPLQIPAISSDGTRILMAAGGTGPCGLAACPVPPCSAGGISSVPRCPLQASHLYMRVADSVTYDVSQGHDVNFVGMTADGSKVYFTSAEQLTSEDRDNSIDLYMWSEAGEREGRPLVLVSKGDDEGNVGEPGQSDDCHSDFTTDCGVSTYSNLSYCQLESGVGGNCRSDSFVASESGEIYFFSPEQLDGSRGIPNQENMYVFRNGGAQYVTTLTTGPYCTYTLSYATAPCGIESDGPIVRMQVTPSGEHMAFITASQVTKYDNAGHLEMYTYDPTTRDVTCVSCIPSGAAPTSDVQGSQDGLFLTNDGRTFFTTEDALVHTDTNKSLDVYEYVNGRAQLITPGTGETRQENGIYVFNQPGLVGVSADGTDVYFSTVDTLVPQDHNGLFLKFYDARAGGGFSASAGPPPCDAADECHGAGSSPPSIQHAGTEAQLGTGGNLAHGRGRKRRSSKRRHHRRRRAHRSSTGPNAGSRHARRFPRSTGPGRVGGG